MSETDTPQLNARAAYGRLWREWLAPHWPKMLLATFFMLIVALATAGYAKFMEWVISALEVKDASVIWWGPAGIVALTLSKGIAHYLQQVVQNRVLSRVQAEMQKFMYDRLVYMDLAYLLAEAPAALAARFSADIELVRQASITVFGSVRDVLTLIAAIIVMLSIDWAMAIGLVLVFALAFGPIGIAGARIRRISASTQSEIAHMTEAVNEGLTGIRMVRTYQLEESLKKTSNHVFDKLVGLRISLVKWQALITPMIEVLAGIAIAVLLFLVAWRMQSGAIDLAGFIGLITALGVATNPARKLGGAYAVGLQGMAALERVYALFDTKNDISDGDFTYPEGSKPEGHIEFRNVGFTYPDGYAALHDINLDIEAGKTFAFVGRSGAGKSTIFNLLPRLFDASEGHILIDGHDLTEHQITSLRNQISVVSQDSVLLSGTVLENIGFGREGATREACIQAAKAAAADEFISALPQGYDTRIDPSKSSFSGGERQRLSIARAMLRDAPILLLDEPTSALDAESEAAIRKGLDALSKGRTTLVIAHRLATILDADQIVVMDQGRIVDQGTHEELLKRGGIYADLFNLQFDMKAEGGKRKRPRSFAARKRKRGLMEMVSRFVGMGNQNNPL
ncbi:ABC transporter ATP-binding protein [Neptunicoccus cionae]|uniref:ABC transporter ATP-binding protein n=1 Tax=Neptunicoccus cionae TaxID=2035344 RepID=UPI000C78BEF2|nr:ABC transporter ATP-binding protein [Amylibacter cionae]PLS23583.1 ABC transporter ATP-binding protein [Amylibacter cionae]